MTEQHIHPFESANLGTAPFTYLGCTKEQYQACPGAPIQPGSSCDYCGQGIMYVCHVRGADGRKFKVGCDCVAKVYAKGTKVRTWVERKVAEQKKVAAAERLAERIVAARAALDASPALLTDRPHPMEYWAERGKTLRDSILWLLDNGGAQGKTRAVRVIEAEAS